VAGQQDADLWKARARLLARAAVADGVAAVNVGRRDLGAGVGFLEGLARDTRIPWVSTNVRAAAGEYPFPRWRVIPWGGLSVAVVGVAAPDPTLDRSLALELEVPAEAIRAVLPHLAGVSAVICLSDLGLAAERELARRIPELTLIVGGGTAEYLPVPPVEGNTVVLHASDRGRYLGVLDLPSAGLRAWRSPRDLQQETALGARLQALTQRLASGEAEEPALREQLAQVQASLAALSREPAVFSHRIAVLDGRGGEDPERLGWVQEQLRFEAEWRRGRAGAAGPAPPPPARESVPAPSASPAPSGGALHAGSASCRECHAGEYQAWVGTPHARAYAALQGGTRDPACLACHAPALQRATGASLEPVVGCEICHGPGGRHRGRGNIARRPGDAVCRSCHRGYHPDEQFSLPGAYEAIRCDRAR